MFFQAALNLCINTPLRHRRDRSNIPMGFFCNFVFASDPGYAAIKRAAPPGT
jgi:hypothetical protein